MYVTILIKQYTNYCTEKKNLLTIFWKLHRPEIGACKINYRAFV